MYRTKITKTTLIFDPNFKFKKSHKIKPSGFWYGIKDEWYNFWKQIEKTDLKHFYKITIKNFKKNSININSKSNNHKILVLKTKQDKITFEKKYGHPDEEIPEIIFIDWSKVMKDYGGIELLYINKNKTKKNEEFFEDIWVDVFDVRSGCIWSEKLLHQIKVEKITKKSFLEYFKK